MVDVHSPSQRSFNMSRIKGRDTKPEILVRSMLHRKGFRFRKNVGTLPGKPDLVLPRYKAVVLIHGCYWHRHSACRYATTPSTNTVFWSEKFRGTVVRDETNQLALTAMGWRVFTVWECELRDNAADTVDILIGRLRGEELETGGITSEGLSAI